MTNMRNFVVLDGALSADPIKYANADGSTGVQATIMAKDNFQSKGRDGKKEYQSKAIDIETYVRAGGVNPFDRLIKGSKVGVMAHLKREPVVRTVTVTLPDGTKATGKATIWETKVVVDDVDFKESLQATEARQLRKQAEAAGAELVTEQAGLTADPVVVK